MQFLVNAVYLWCCLQILHKSDAEINANLSEGTLAFNEPLKVLEHVLPLRVLLFCLLLEVGEEVTLWAEQIIAHKSVEPIKADDFIHVHVMPKENATLLHRRYRYSEMGLEETWRNLILDQSKYKWIEPKNIVKLIDESGRYAKLVQYLNLRYGY